MAVASAGPYASLHLVPDRDNHASTPTLSFLQAGCTSRHPTNSINALKATTTAAKKLQTTVDKTDKENKENLNECEPAMSLFSAVSDVSLLPQYYTNSTQLQTLSVSNQ